MPLIDSYPDPFIAPSSTSQLDVIFDLLPDDGIDLAVWQPRIRVEETEVDVMPGLVINDRELSKTASFVIANIDQKSLFTSSALIDVGIGKKDVSGAWVEALMIWEITDGALESSSLNLTGIPHNSNDIFSVVVAAKSNERLNKTSEKGLIVYDSNRVTISDGDFKAIIDANGNVYTPEVMAVPNLKMSDLFQEVFVNRCGFTSYETNLPVARWPIQRYSVGMGQRFYDGLKGLIGMYRPIIKVAENTIGIYDSTVALPDGVTVGKQIYADKIEQLETSTEQQRLDALMVNYVGLENNYDFTTVRFEYPEEASGESRVEYERIIVEFRKITSPTTNVVIREALNIENKQTYINDVLVEDSNEQYNFNSAGEVEFRLKTIYSLLPDLPDAALVMKRIREERESFVYQAHPFKQRSQFCARRTLRSQGLVTIDADNVNISGEAARQAADIAWRSNNFVAGQTYAFEALGSRIESAQPQKDGTVLVRVIHTDAINPINSIDYFEKRPGDIGVSGVASSQEMTPVFANDITARTAQRIDDFPIGELPLEFGLPLARRSLIFQQTKGRVLSLDHIGYDKSLQNGVAVSAYNRGLVAIGNFLIEGRQILCSNGLTLKLACREIAGTVEPLQRIGSQSGTIESGSEIIWTLPVECRDGFVLTLDPVTVANLTIEARHVETPPLSWTNLETTAIDLSPFSMMDGDRNFEFKFTAAAVSEITRIQFAIITRVLSEGAVTFTPADTTGALWLRAKSIAGMADDDPVGTWTNIIAGATFNVSQATSGKRPVYKTNSGQPYIAFDGTDDTLDGDDNLDLGTNSLHIFAVVRGAGSTVPVISKSVAATSDGRWAMLKYPSDVQGTLYSNSAGVYNNLNSLSLGANFVLLEAVIDRVNGTVAIYINGTLNDSDSFTPDAATNVNTSHILHVGSYNDQIFGAVDIKELFVAFDVKIGTTLANMRNYFNDEHSLGL